MDSLSDATEKLLTWSPRPPGWTRSRGCDINESDVAFVAGIALKSLDDLIHGKPTVSAALFGDGEHRKS